MAIPKFGRLTNPMENILEEIDLTAKLGFDFVEIGIEGPGGDPKVLIRNKNKILRVIRDNNLFAIGHTSWWFELGSTYESVRRGWVEEGKRIIMTSKELEINLINFHTHSIGLFMDIPSARKEVLDNYVKSMKELVDYGKSLGVKVMLENAAERREICDLADVKHIIDRVRGLGFHLDVGHAYIQGGMKGVMDYIRVLSPKLWHVHMHDNHGYEDEHLPIGSGKIQFGKIVSALKKIGYDKTITPEVFGKTPGSAQRSMKKLKKLWVRK
ncbi:MAG: sugar phosphate isomerase/epimerase [Candidatus Aenigmarchaeota archaeon]|nr:sugar phosphate isomerase/epimerase [Candidatus Aenigmarchaeota archaeon]